uniref:Uncharacterized protein n=1 Tax=Oncorhynchus mykiss TaxID=8022 RepID=A0A8C7TKK9_ONCMY
GGVGQADFGGGTRLTVLGETTH